MRFKMWSVLAEAAASWSAMAAALTVAAARLACGDMCRAA